MNRRTLIVGSAAVASVGVAPVRALASPFDRYVAEINRLAEQCGAVDPGKPYCEPEAWREMYVDGLSPAEAWAEECYAAWALS